MTVDNLYTTYIDGKKFYKYGLFERKAAARRAARYYRQKGYHARVIKNRTSNKWEVWLD